MRRRTVVRAVWVVLCAALFVVMFTAPVPGAKAPQGFYYECPSLATMLVLGNDPSLEAKARHGIGPSPTYFKCSRGPAGPWALTSVLVPSLLCALGLWSLGRPWAHTKHKTGDNSAPRSTTVRR